jgi:Family of unknown function (DUF6065)
MKLTAYVLDGVKLHIRPAPLEREWMDATDLRFAYRCLPLNIANSYGWELLCPSDFTAIWYGGATTDAIHIQSGYHTMPAAVSQFGYGILTFHVNCVFRTEPGFDLMAQGPINRPKDGISALAGIIETDWAPYTFTMNWQFTRKGVPVTFKAGEPFCHIIPVRRGEIETFEPELKPISEQPELHQQLKTWIDSRTRFNTQAKRPGTKEYEEGWQKRYFRGLDVQDRPGEVADHHTRVKLRPFQGE